MATVTEITIGNQKFNAEDVLAIAEWEDNGFHDSDFYRAYFIRSTGAIKVDLIGTTRFYGGIAANQAKGVWTKDDVEKFRKCFETYIFCSLLSAENRDIFHPDQIADGDRVRLTQDKNARKAYKTKPCEKCNGTGNWVNPKKPQDVRSCFSCKGSGIWKDKESFKACVVPSGTPGTVLTWGTFRTIHRNGYNKLGNNTINCSVLVEVEGEKLIVSVDLCNLRLDREPLTQEELQKKAEDLSYYWQITSFLGCKAWLSKTFVNFAALCPRPVEKDPLTGIIYSEDHLEAV